MFPNQPTWLRCLYTVGKDLDNIKILMEMGLMKSGVGKWNEWNSVVFEPNQLFDGIFTGVCHICWLQINGSLAYAESIVLAILMEIATRILP